MTSVRSTNYKKFVTFALFTMGIVVVEYENHNQFIQSGNS